MPRDGLYLLRIESQKFRRHSPKYTGAMCVLWKTQQTVQRAACLHSYCATLKRYWHTILIHQRKSSKTSRWYSLHLPVMQIPAVTACCIRFFHTAKTQAHPDLNADRGPGPLTSSEIRRALTHWVKTSQLLYFSDDLDRILFNQPIRKTSAIAYLTLFLEDNGVLIVGGRLQNAQLTRDAAHPIMLVQECHLSTLLVRDAHAKTLHGGPQLTRNHLLQRY